MSAGKYDLKIEQGATFTRKFLIKNLDTPVDLTGQTFRGCIRKTASSANIIETFTMNVKDQVTNTGEFEISLTATQTSGIPVNKSKTAEREITSYAYDIEREFSDGRVERVLEGLANVSPEVTR
jgi:hypothetical protein